MGKFVGGRNKDDILVIAGECESVEGKIVDKVP